MAFSIFKKLLFQSAAYTALMLLVCLGLNTFLSGNYWEGMTISKSALTAEYCEFNNTQRFFHQSMNTYSNLAYVYFGVLIFLIGKFDAHNQGFTTQNRLEKFPALSKLMGICFVYLGFGSAFFHASLTWIGQRVDMNGAYGISIVLICIGFYHVLNQAVWSRQAKNGMILVALVLMLAFYKIALLISSSVLLPSMILGTWLLSGIHFVQDRKNRSTVLALISLVLIVVAIKIRAMDVAKINCDPHSWIQGHSIWHLLTALSSFCSYAFFRFTFAKP